MIKQEIAKRLREILVDDDHRSLPLKEIDWNLQSEYFRYNDNYFYLVDLLKDISDEDKPILFYGVNSVYGEFSNWYYAPIVIDGKTWSTTEHYYMSQKTHDKELRKKIQSVDSPREAKKIGRKLELRSDWEGIKFDVMVEACYAKFTQHEDLKQLLLDTGHRPIHEDCKDPEWGGGPNFPDGRDLLGKAIVKVRKMIRENK